jgi:hypothetical protein
VSLSPDFERIEQIHDDQVWAEAEEDGQPRDPDLSAYVNALRGLVGETMRLTQSGNPAHWAREFVHSDVIGHFHWPASALIYGAEEATVSIRVTPGYGRIEVRDAQGGIVAKKEIPALGFDFDDWGSLEEAAHDLLSRQIAVLRKFFDERYPDADYPRRNRATVQKRHDQYVPALFRLLFYGKRSVRPTRDTLRQLTEDIGIDLPT